MIDNEVSVLKIGGSTLAEEDEILAEVAQLKKQGHNLVLVHGGGKEIDQEYSKAGIETLKIEGLRVTNKDGMEAVKIALGRINLRLAYKLELMGVNPFPIDFSTGLLQGKIEDPRLGYVGTVSSVNSTILLNKIVQGEVPVVSPITQLNEPPFCMLNTNADAAAAAVSIALPGSRLLFATDVLGVKNRQGEVIPRLHYLQYLELVAQGIITAGMFPKLNEGFKAVKAGNQVQIFHYSAFPQVISGYPTGTRLFH